MNKDRLLRLAQCLRDEVKLKDALHFDLSGWGVAPNIEGCGSYGCAVGTAIHRKIFEAEGLTQRGPTTYSPKFGDLRDWHAVEAFFDLTHQQACWLFSADSYQEEAGKKAELKVAKRIECLAATDGASVPKPSEGDIIWWSWEDRAK